jgi:hypothetical protein
MAPERRRLSAAPLAVLDEAAAEVVAEVVELLDEPLVAAALD